MTETVTWASILASLPALAMTGAICVFAVRAIVRQEIAKLNGTYLRREVADDRFRQIEEHFDFLERQRLSDLALAVREK